MVKRLLNLIVFTMCAGIVFAMPTEAGTRGGKTRASAKAPAPSFTTELQQRINERLSVSCPECMPTWQKLVQTSSIISTGEEPLNNRRQYSAIQLAFEQVITSLLASKTLINAVIAIHTPNIPTPLRVGLGDVPPGVILAQALNDEQYMSSIRQRYQAILDYLKTGSVMFTLHQRYKRPEKIAGYELYDSISKQYPNLRDFQMREFPDDYSGATYLMLTPEGRIYMFSVMATQAGSTASIEWGMWYGDTTDGDDPEVTRRLLHIDSFLVSQDIDLYDAIGVR